MKVSLNLSDDVYRSLVERARSLPGTNPSLLADLAVKLLLEHPPEDIERLAERHRLSRKAVTRDGWRRAFWRLLGHAMGREDLITNPYVARDYGDYYLVLLRSHVAREDDEDDPFYFSMGLRGGTVPGRPAPTPPGWRFERAESPVVAAEAIARRLHELGVTT
ncbi:MAG TPA: hypothetical protein VGX91_05235 [Candidatus Cybelea sp.]|jgi:hypothetical protein|nr:hypothetical protein [Candidatus Cybelea sp.]